MSLFTYSFNGVTLHSNQLKHDDTSLFYQSGLAQCAVYFGTTGHNSRFAYKMPSTRFHLNLAGDVMLGRIIDQLLPTHVHCPEEAAHTAKLIADNPSLEKYDFKSPWGNTLSLFHSAHLNLINLETCVTTYPQPWPDKIFNYRMHPANIQCLKEARIHYVSLANNHTLDFSQEGLLETMHTLRGAGVPFAGTGNCREEACQPAILELRDGGNTYTVHVYSASDHPDDWSVVPNFHLIDYSPATRRRLKNLLTSTISEPHLKVFSVHWGPNYSWAPAAKIKDLAHFLVDECGVDIIHGHSSHHIQAAEVYKGKLVIYGCGDFVDDYAVKPPFRNDLSAIWRVTVALGKAEDASDHKLRAIQLEVFPSRIKGFQANLLDKGDADHEWVRKRFGVLCEGFETVVQTELGEQGQIVVNME